MNRLREVRVVKRITQFRLRLETGISPTKISLGENGLVDFSEGEKQKLAKALGVSVAEIFGDEKIPVDPEENNQSKESLSTGK